MPSRSKNIAYLGIMLALAMIASYIETLIPVFVAVPGVKLGLANAVVMLLLYRKGWRTAVVISFLRIVLSGFLFSGIVMMVYSFSGAALSIIVMVLLKKSGKFSVVGVSVAGGVMHNAGQILAACFFVENAKMFYYLPVLIVSGILTGAIIGILAGILIKRLSQF